jgi:catechol 2,3-dioxygenase-like lactoylglutathione lyase family enzyme
MKITGTHHVALITSNFEQMRAFYTETLGLPVVGAFAGGAIIFLQAGPTTIELIGRATYAPAVGSWDHFAFQVEDVDAAYAELKALGVPFHVEPKSVPDPLPEARIAFFKDPDGNILELFQPLGATYPQNGMR